MKATYRLSDDRKTLTIDLALDGDDDRRMIDNVIPPNDPYACQRLFYIVADEGVSVTLKKEPRGQLESMGWGLRE